MDPDAKFDGDDAGGQPLLLTPSNLLQQVCAYCQCEASIPSQQLRDNPWS